MKDYYFEFNYDKNLQLLKERNITFEQVIALIDAGSIVDVIEHPNQEKYPGQKIYIVDVDGYCYLVPYVTSDKKIFLKTIIPSRKATKEYLKKNKPKEI